MEMKIGLFSAFALASASSPQGYQSTGLWACWRRFGLAEWISRFENDSGCVSPIAGTANRAQVIIAVTNSVATNKCERPRSSNFFEESKIGLPRDKLRAFCSYSAMS